MAKRKKKSKAGPLVGGIAALALIGALLPAEEQQEVEQPQPPAIVEEVETPTKATENETTNKDEISETPANDTTVKQEIILPTIPVEEKPIETVQPVEKTPDPEPVLSPEPASSPTPEPNPVEIDPKTAFREKLMQYAYVGSAESDKYHSPTCHWTKDINDTNLVHFDSEDEASAAGYVPCGTCKP